MNIAGGAVPDVNRRKLSIAEYHQMAAAGIIGAQERVELIHGEIIKMTPIGGKHVNLVNWLNQKLVMAVGDRGIVSVQNPVLLLNDSEPEPDIVVYKPRDDFYGSDIPTSVDALLVIEVADISLRYDRGVKIPLYASYGIPEVWLVDVSAESMTLYLEPSDGSYAQVTSLKSGKPQSLIAASDIHVDLSRLFGR